jgi:hypothetical protein
MLRDALIPVLARRFPGRFVISEPGIEPFVTFPAIHPEVGDVQIQDDEYEITLIAGNFTHGHFSNYEDIPTHQKEEAIAEDVADFLEKLFADQVVLWGSHRKVGGWRVLDTAADKPRYRNEYVWSGPWNR